MSLLTCGVCGSVFDARIVASHPQNDSLPFCASMCFHCGEMSILESGPFGEYLREPTMPELIQIEQAHGRLMRTMRDFRATRPGTRHGQPHNRQSGSA